MRKNLLVFLAAVSCAATFPTALANPAEEHLMVAPDQMKWNAIPSLPPGAQGALIEGQLDKAEPFTLRLKLPANYRIPPHWHPAVERVTVMSGAFMLGMGDKFDESKMHTVPRGGVAIMQPKTRHYAMVKEATEIQLHGMGPWGINYINPADDPRKK